jgi:hypothetical protein
VARQSELSARHDPRSVALRLVGSGQHETAGIRRARVATRAVLERAVGSGQAARPRDGPAGEKRCFS